MFKALLLFILTAAPLIFAVDGHTFNIEEEDMAQAIFERLTSITEREVEELRLKAQEKIMTEAKAPSAVRGLREATEYAAYYFDPTYMVKEEITDLTGNVIAYKGQTINPLKSIGSLQELLFFDGDNPDHVKWAKEHPEAKWILVKGSPIELEEESIHPVFFDQGAALCRFFGLERIPTKISKSGDRLIIEEIPCAS